MRIILFILLFFSLQSQAQIIRANPLYRPIAVGSSCSYLLDQYSGAAAAYSLRKLDCDYSGYAIKVRESGGNTESDIGFTANGDLDTAALKTFVGANSGYVTTMYDQSGNSGRNATQTTTGEQPRIINAGVIERLNGQPSLYFNVSSFSAADCLSGASAASLFFVAKIYADPPVCNTCGAVVEQTGSGSSSHFPYADANIYDGFATNTRKSTGDPTVNLANGFLYYALSASGNWRSYLNNALQYSTATNTVASGTLYIGHSTNSALTFKGHISEVIIYNSNKDSDRTSISTNINSYYTIY